MDMKDFAADDGLFDVELIDDSRHRISLEDEAYQRVPVAGDFVHVRKRGTPRDSYGSYVEVLVMKVVMWPRDPARVYVTWPSQTDGSPW